MRFSAERPSWLAQPRSRSPCDRGAASAGNSREWPSLFAGRSARRFRRSDRRPRWRLGRPLSTEFVHRGSTRVAAAKTCRLASAMHDHGGGLYWSHGSVGGWTARRTAPQSLTVPPFMNSARRGRRLSMRAVVDDGDIATCGGVTSSIDLALWLVQRIWGAPMSDKIANGMEYIRNPGVHRASPAVG